MTTATASAAGREAVRPRTAVVVGAGAVGSFLGGTLASAGWDVTLLGRQAGGAAAATQSVPSSLLIDGPEGRRTVPVRRIADPAAGPPSPDLVILAVKAFDLGGALDAAASWPDAPVMTVQNGVGAEAEAAAARTSPLIAASLTTAVEPIDGGVARRRRGGIGLAPVRGDVRNLVHELADAFADGGLPTAVCADPASMKWSKLLANLVGNASAAILAVDPGAVWADRSGFDLERRQLREAVAVMRALGLDVVSLPGAGVGLLLTGLRFPAIVARPIMSAFIGRARGGKAPSLLLGMRAGGGRTEARWLNGAVADAGAGAGVATPVNACLAMLVDRIAADPPEGAAWSGDPGRLLAATRAWPDGR